MSSKPLSTQSFTTASARHRRGDTYARLAAGFHIGTSTAWRYVQEAVDLLATLADDVHAAALRTRRLAHAILDGTLIPINRPADDARGRAG